MSLDTIAAEYITHVRAGSYIDLIEQLYAADAVSVEPHPRPGESNIAEGRDALLAKSRAFDEHFTVHSHQIAGPWPHGQDRFAVHMTFEMTHLASGQRTTTDEIAVITVRDGKITREEFFYT